MSGASPVEASWVRWSIATPAHSVNCERERLSISRRASARRNHTERIRNPCNAWWADSTSSKATFGCAAPDADALSTPCVSSGRRAYARRLGWSM